MTCDDGDDVDHERTSGRTTTTMNDVCRPTTMLKPRAIGADMPPPPLPPPLLLLLLLRGIPELSI